MKYTAALHFTAYAIATFLVVTPLFASDDDTTTANISAPHQPDTITVTDTIAQPKESVSLPVPDSLAVVDSLQNNSTPDDSLQDRNTPVESVDTAGGSLMTRPQSDSSAGDTTRLADGTSFEAEFGWSLGSFALTDYWERALPDSLGSFGLSTTSFKPDTGIDLTGIALYDTAALIYTVKEQPSIYTMSFPIAFSVISLTEKRRFTFSLRGSWMRKVLISSIGFRDDTSGAKVDYRQSINVYSLFLSTSYGTRIPEEYFSVDGIERCYFTAGIDLSPLIAAKIASDASATIKNERLNAIRMQCAEPYRSLHGGAAAMRFGLSMLKRINRTSATDVSLTYSVQAYGYFFQDGNRMTIRDIHPGYAHKDRPLFWISNRFEIAIALLHQPRTETNNQ